MISELVIDSINEVQKTEIFVELNEQIVGIAKPRKVSDSFDATDSEIGYSYRGYDYSPEYKLEVEERALGRSKPQYEEDKYQYDETEDFDDGHFDHNVGKYSIDTSKMVTKMEDVGISPYKIKKRLSPRQQTDAICINCDEYISAKNIEIHSQYCTGEKQPQTAQPIRETLHGDYDQEYLDFDGVETDTIPRVNQRLYKLIKALKRKEVECIRSSIDVNFVHSLSSMCKDIMVNNIDLQKLERSGEKLGYSIYNYEHQIRAKTSHTDSLLIIANLMHQIYGNKRELVKQEEDFYYAYGGFDQPSDDYIPVSQPQAYEGVRLGDISNDPSDELEKQEKGTIYSLICRNPKMEKDPS